MIVRSNCCTLVDHIDFLINSLGVVFPKGIEMFNRKSNPRSKWRNDNRSNAPRAPIVQPTIPWASSNLPSDLMKLFTAFKCILCNMNLNKTDPMEHYGSKQHFTNMRGWISARPQYSNVVIPTSDKEILNMNPELICTDCNVFLGNHSNAKGHYSGKKHQEVVDEKAAKRRAARGHSPRMLMGYCEHCDVHCGSDEALRLHTHGAEHRKNTSHMNISHSGENMRSDRGRYEEGPGKRPRYNSPPARVSRWNSTTEQEERDWQRRSGPQDMDGQLTNPWERDRAPWLEDTEEEGQSQNQQSFQQDRAELDFVQQDFQANRAQQGLQLDRVEYGSQRDRVQQGFRQGYQEDYVEQAFQQNPVQRGLMQNRVQTSLGLNSELPSLCVPDRMQQDLVQDTFSQGRVQQGGVELPGVQQGLTLDLLAGIIQKYSQQGLMQASVQPFAFANSQFSQPTLESQTVSRSSRSRSQEYRKPTYQRHEPRHPTARSQTYTSRSGSPKYRNPTYQRHEPRHPTARSQTYTSRSGSPKYRKSLSQPDSLRSRSAVFRKPAARESSRQAESLGYRKPSPRANSSRPRPPEHRKPVTESRLATQTSLSVKRKRSLVEKCQSVDLWCGCCKLSFGELLSLAKHLVSKKHNIRHKVVRESLPCYCWLCRQHVPNMHAYCQHMNTLYHTYKVARKLWSRCFYLMCDPCGFKGRNIDDALQHFASQQHGKRLAEINYVVTDRFLVSMSQGTVPSITTNQQVAGEVDVVTPTVKVETDADGGGEVEEGAVKVEENLGSTDEGANIAEEKMEEAADGMEATSEVMTAPVGGHDESLVESKLDFTEDMEQTWTDFYMEDTVVEGETDAPEVRMKAEAAVNDQVEDIVENNDKEENAVGEKMGTARGIKNGEVKATEAGGALGDEVPRTSEGLKEEDLDGPSNLCKVKNNQGSAKKPSQGKDLYDPAFPTDDAEISRVKRRRVRPRNRTHVVKGNRNAVIRAVHRSNSERKENLKQINKIFNASSLPKEELYLSLRPSLQDEAFSLIVKDKVMVMKRGNLCTRCMFWFPGDKSDIIAHLNGFAHLQKTCNPEFDMEDYLNTFLNRTQKNRNRKSDEKVKVDAAVVSAPGLVDNSAPVDSVPEPTADTTSPSDATSAPQLAVTLFPAPAPVSDDVGASPDLALHTSLVSDLVNSPASALVSEPVHDLPATAVLAPAPAPTPAPPGVDLYCKTCDTTLADVVCLIHHLQSVEHLEKATALLKSETLDFNHAGLPHEHEMKVNKLLNAEVQSSVPRKQLTEAEMNSLDLTCRFCHTTSVDIVEFINHLKSAAHVQCVSPTESCDICAITLPDVVTSIKHCRAKPHEERIAQMVYNHRGALRSSVQELECEACSYITTTSDQFIFHLISPEHEEMIKKNPGAFGLLRGVNIFKDRGTAKDTELSSNSVDELQDSLIETVEDKELKYRCKLCEDDYATKPELLLHLQGRKHVGKTNKLYKT